MSITSSVMLPNEQFLCLKFQSAGCVGCLVISQNPQTSYQICLRNGRGWEGFPEGGGGRGVWGVGCGEGGGGVSRGSREGGGGVSRGSGEGGGGVFRGSGGDDVLHFHGVRKRCFN